jgi:tetratricopeptide (TPR) repeat protein
VRCLARGLAADSAARWPSMTALVDAIERAARRPAQRRRAALVAVLATAVLGAGLVVASAEDPVAAARSTAAQRIATAWNAPRKASLEARFLASGTPLAGERTVTTIQLLDAYRDRWLAARFDAWAATHRGGDQSTEDLGRRLVCLDQLADAMERLVGLFLIAGAADVQEAPQSVYRLEPIASCANLERLAARPAAPAMPIAILAERPLRELEALQRAGRYAEANQRAPGLIDPAVRFGTAALRARARYDLGAVQSLVGRFTDAEATLRLAVQEAAHARDHERVADGWLRLLNVTGFGLQRYDAAAAIEPAVRAAVAQAGDDPRQLAELAKTLGLIASTRGEAEVARAHFTEARSLHIATRGAQDPVVGTDESNIGATLLDLERDEEAAPHFERAIAILRAAYGDHHPAIAGAEHNLVTIAANRNDWAAAERHARAAIAINLVVVGPDHPGVANNRIQLARVLREQKRFSEARAEIERARATFERALPANHPTRLTFDLYPALVDDAEGRTERAIDATRRVVAAIEHADVPEPQRAFAILQLATLVSHRSPSEALPIFEQALRGYVAPDAPRKRGDVELLRAFSEAALHAGQPAVALRWFDQVPAALSAELADLRQQLERAAHR